MADIVLTGDTSGAITIAAPDVSGTNTLTLPASTGTLLTTTGDGSSLTGINPSFGRVVRTAGTITTTSTSLVDVTGATVTITTGAFPVGYGFWGVTMNSIQGQRVHMNIMVDAALQLGTQGTYWNQEVAGLFTNSAFSGQSDVLSAGAHTTKAQWSVSAGTGTLVGTSANSAMFYAQEIK